MDRCHVRPVLVLQREVLGRDHVVTEPDAQGLNAARGALVPGAELDSQVLDDQSLEHGVDLGGGHFECLRRTWSASAGIQEDS